MTRNWNNSTRDEKIVNKYNSMGCKIPICIFCAREYFGAHPGYCSSACYDAHKKVKSILNKDIETPLEQLYLKTKNEYKLILDKLEDSKNKHQTLQKEYNIILEESKNKHQILQKEYKIIVQKLINIKKQL